MPEAPTSDPAMISTVLFITKPVAQAARPENEFNSAMTTGMSAPPMDSESTTPRTPATAARTQNSSMLPGSKKTITPRPRLATAENIFKAFMPGKRPCLISRIPPMIRPESITIAARTCPWVSTPSVRKPAVRPYHRPVATTTREKPYLMIRCQAWSFHLTARNSASLPKAT